MNVVMIYKYGKRFRFAPAFNDPVVTESKGMQKSPEFDASYDPIVTESKGMLKTPEFHASYDPVVTESKGMQKNSRI